MTLKQRCCRYLETHVDGSVFEEDLSTGKYLCWSIPHQDVYQVYNWLGRRLRQEIVKSRRYVWLGNKGAIYVTKSSIFEKTQNGDNGIVSALKQAQ